MTNELSDSISPKRSSSFKGGKAMLNGDGQIDTDGDTNLNDAEMMPLEESEEAAKVRLLPSPTPPSRQEMLEHNISHMPFRSWCPHCVAGKGKAASHFKQERQDGMPEIHVDYCFLSTKNGPLATVLVAKGERKW